MNMLILLFGNLNAQAQGAAGGGSIVQMLLPFALIFGVFYFLLIRPQQKQKNVHQKFLNELKKGDEVYTASGIIGTVNSISDKFVTIEISENVKIKIIKGMVQGNAKQALQETEKKG